MASNILKVFFQISWFLGKREPSKIRLIQYFGCFGFINVNRTVSSIPEIHDNLPLLCCPLDRRISAWNGKKTFMIHLHLI